MKVACYRSLLTAGICGMVLVGCQSENTGQSSLSSDARSSQETSSQAASESSSQTDNSVNSESEQSESRSGESDPLPELDLQMDSELVLLPNYFPNLNNNELNSEAVKNEPDEYQVIYHDNAGNQQAEMNGKILESKEAAIEYLKDQAKSPVDSPENTQNGEDLGYGITGYGDAGAGNYYFSWEEGNWILTIHSLLKDEMDVTGTAKLIVEYLESHELPAPTAKGLIYMDYGAEGENPHIQIIWNDDTQVYELNTVRVPIDALDMILSLE